MAFVAGGDRIAQAYMLNQKGRKTVQIMNAAMAKRVLPMIACLTREGLYGAGDTLCATGSGIRKMRNLTTFPAGQRRGVVTVDAGATMPAGSVAAPE